MEQTVLNKVKGTGASLEGANMTGARQCADFEKAAAARVRLDGADFTGANLVGVTLDEASMEQTVLNKVKGTGASLEGANMTGAKASADFEKSGRGESEA